MGWRNRPTYIHKWPDNVDYTMFVDENGDSNLSYVKKQRAKGLSIDDEHKIFSITGCALKKEHLVELKKSTLAIKYKYWEDGKFEYKGKKIKRVCFHSSDIRGRKGPFSESVINYGNFINDLTTRMDELPVTIFSSSINKEEHCRKYINPLHPYDLCLDFVLERFAKFYLKNDETGIIMLESRGAKEDLKVLKHIINTIDNGTKYVGKTYFKKIKGVYFNPKWCKKSSEQKTYFGLEYADLLAYPIYKYLKNNVKDKAYDVLEKKIYGYPIYYSKGLKTFP